ncbi:hypothetical protein [Occultella kanbiaonis]|uniref:hypothetical protein n=1 Tax=Occultella kanbiaonis TaxID=2675754 RepID=UPI0013D84160|nr:hypothetical protein [Occultella kanbiaonis]
MTQPPVVPPDPPSRPGPWTDLVVRNMPAAVTATYRPRVSLLSIVLVAWVGVGVGLIVSGNRSIGAGVLAASLALLVVFVTTLAAWLSRTGTRPVLVINGLDIELCKPRLRLAWHTIQAVEVQPARGWLRTPAIVLRLRAGVNSELPGPARYLHGWAQWHHRRGRRVVVDVTTLDTPLHTLVEAISTASGGSVQVPRTGLR